MVTCRPRGMKLWSRDSQISVTCDVTCQGRSRDVHRPIRGLTLSVGHVTASQRGASQTSISASQQSISASQPSISASQTSISAS